MRIGVVDLDTSHPENWIPIERDLGHEVVGLWDGGSIHPVGYAEKFAEEHKIPKVYPSLEAMVDQVDCAVIHGCDWDTHIDKARVFVEAGKGILLDKPLAGNLGDLNQLKAWTATGARVTGGSSLRFCAETRDWLAAPVEKRGTPQTVVCGCGVDEFNYGIHAYSMLAGIMGTGAASIRHLGKSVQRRIQIDYGDGRTGLIVIGETAKWLPFYTTIVTQNQVAYFKADAKKLYRSQLEAVLPYLSGETEEPPIAMDELIEPELWALAARRSWTEGDRAVELSELTEEDDGYDGAEFADEYRKSKYPS
ncbi:MAG: Gfo/Idh/MocA family oxidoreductase [Phycisphaerae bacterium]|nr:Gfo/Idh/MocA family oxidoreductase [Phycisphaerae bacterium]